VLVRYHPLDVSQSDRQTDGQLSERPLVELLREIIDARLSGALRLSRAPVKVAVYFEKGDVVFGTSNLRAHRLREVLKRHGVLGRELDGFSSSMSDEELGTSLVNKGLLTEAALQDARRAQATEVLRVALLWGTGDWSYDPRVRLAPEARVTIDVNNLLLECARHLPLAFLRSRAIATARNYLITKHDQSFLSPTETRTFAYIVQNSNEANPAALVRNGLREQDALRAIYALFVGGLVQPHDYQTILTEGSRTQPAAARPPVAAPPAENTTTEDDVNALFTRLYSAKTHYDVLDIASTANLRDIKAAYHDLARRYHPDRFHQSELRPKIESAFARIGRAYETLSDDVRRRDYNKTLTSKKPGKLAAAKEPAVTKETGQSEPLNDRAEAAFQLGAEAMERNQYVEAMRCFGEAAMLAPRVARYRAYYGSALMHNPTQRRTAETELQAALKMEPNNAGFRVMLAKLYQQIGLRKRAESEATRALSEDPTNASARALLSSLTTK
jgi:curved DNA-binding protein CbpA